MGREKHREKDREKEYGEKEHRDKERKHRDREKEKHHEERKRSRREDDGVEVKEKRREREREGKKEREREREREREVEEERDRKRRKKDEEEEEEEREKVRVEEEREREREKVRDREREKEKEKSREKHRERGREKERERDREGEGRERDRDRKRRRKDEDGGRDDVKVKKEMENDEDPEEEQKRLDDEIDKRRRRVQEWQELRRRKEEEDRQKRGLVQADADVVSSPKNVKKTWTLEGEDSDDEDDSILPKSEAAAVTRVAAFENGDLVMADVGGNGNGSSEGKHAKLIPKLEDYEEKTPATIPAIKVKQEVEEEEEEVDPLDAFMNSIAIPEVSSADAVVVEVPETKPSFSNRALKKGQENNKFIKRNTKNTLGRIMPGDDSASEDEDDGEGKEGDEDDDEFLKRVKKTKAEKLAIVDHSKIQYPTFRKNFYIEVKEISRMTLEEAAAYRKELELKIRGKDVPRPLKTWNQTGLNNKVLDVIKKAGFEKPMPIQAQALPIIMSGRDCIGIAKTGSGKTLAFVLPMLRHIMDQPPLQQGDGPIGLIMAPTRELVQQIYNDIRKFSKVVGLTCVPVYGGSGVAQQISDLKRGTEIVVCTPGRMIDILCTSAGKITNLRRVTYLVMDEADRMFDMGFEPQITRIVQNTRPDRQTVLFSATFPRQVEVLARKVLTRPVEIQIGGRSVVNSDITQTVEVRPESERFLRLLELLGEWYEKGKVLVFVHSQEKCDSLFRDLLKAGYPCLSLHGAKDQTDRESTITDFKTSVCNLMIATSIAARGLDVKELELVVNYDVPNHYEDYVHRVGRTGRAGRKGCSVTFISPEEERYAPDLVKALELSEQPIPEDLKKLADDFMLKVKQGSEQAHGSGYGGSGFKFNEEEDEALKAVKKAQAREYGFEEEEDKTDSESDDEGIRKAGGEMSQVVNMQAAALAAAAKAGLPSGMNPALAANPQLQAALASMAQAAAANQAASAGAAALPGMAFPGVAVPGLAGMSMPGMAGMPGMPGMPMIPNMAQIMASMGMPSMGGVPNYLANQMALANMAGAMGHLGSPMLGAMGAGASATAGLADGNPAARAAAMAAAYNLQNSLAKIQADVAQESYEIELEINDFPQHARWKVTHKDALGQISEWTGAAITTRGQYFPPGKVPAPGERKLFLFIEGPTETSVKKAKAEVKRILEESTASAIQLPGPAQPGKYSVV
ncbi:hypothetical protein KC19_5G016100 [Ceratodon purpureus]|uniref:RNA helicase n=1 Tax=Ceratodon purpureus TaxID=3225 RepID=A0A8T0HY90_CERPU|nr:hypothetical protein KC19_5G016100 [Ceratodon purpureus]